MDVITAPERSAIAIKLGLSEQYLYQCLTGRRDMKTDEAVRVESESGGRIRRWHVRTTDWWKHWPELVGQPGAPKVPTQGGTR